MPSLFCLWDFGSPKYLALLLALNFDRCCKLVLSSPPPLLSCCPSQTPFALAISFLFSMAKQNSAKSFFERARARDSENNEDSIIPGTIIVNVGVPAYEVEQWPMEKYSP